MNRDEQARKLAQFIKVKNAESAKHEQIAKAGDALLELFPDLVEILSMVSSAKAVVREPSSQSDRSPNE